MSKGWVLIHRQIWENPRWNKERFTEGQAMVDLILLANHEERIFSVRGNDITVKRGQIARSRESLGGRWRWHRKTVGKFLDELEKEGMISQQKTAAITIMTLINYNEYQDYGQQNDQQNDQQKRVRSAINKEHKEQKETYDVRPETKSLYDYIQQECEKYGLQNDVKIKALDIQVTRHLSKVRLRVEVQKCLVWIIDKNLKSVSTRRLANWFEKSREIQKREENRNLEQKEMIGQNQHRQFTPLDNV